MGREEDLTRLEELLLDDEIRLLTLTGSGGTGKTRLALAVATRVKAAFPDGELFIDLAALSDPALVLPTVGQALGVVDQGTPSVLRSLASKLRLTSPLLILDNFEHVTAAARDLAALLEAGATAKLLVTSREALNLRWEQEYRVEPLRVPVLEDHPAPESLLTIPAVALFTARARAVDPKFELNEDNAPAVAALCRRLDGLPLALELAAARMKLLPPQELLSRFGECLDLLEADLRDAPPRHRTLRAAIDWSLGLLDRRERRLVRRLGVFAESWTLSAAEAIGAASGPPGSVASLLASLVDKSLVRRIDEPGAGEARYRLLETLRARALDDLSTSGHTTETRRQHAEYFVSRIEAVGEDLFATRPEALRQVAREQDDLRAALGWLVRHGHRNLALRLATTMYFWWLFSGQLTEGLGWLEAVLALPREPDEPAAVWARAVSGRAGLLARTGDASQVLQRAEEALAVASEVGDPRALGHAHLILGLTRLDHGDPEGAVEQLERTREVGRQSGEAYWEAISLAVLARVDESSGRLGQAEARFERAIGLFRSSGQIWGLARALGYAAGFELRRGKRHRSAALAREALVLHRALGSVWMEADCFTTLAQILATEGKSEAAATLEGIAAALGEVQQEASSRSGTGASPSEAPADEDPLRQATVDFAWRVGHAMTLGDAIDFALAAGDSLAVT